MAPVSQKREKKPWEELEDDELVRKLFPKRVVEEAKRGAEPKREQPVRPAQVPENSGGSR